VDPPIAELAREQHGVVGRAQLLAAGIGRRAIDDRLATGRLHEGHWLAAVLAAGVRAVLSHFSAAALWCMVEWDGRRPEVTVVGAGTRSHPGLRLHRTVQLEPRDIRRRAGIPVTSPARTLADIAPQLSYPALRRVVRQALSLRLLSTRELVETIGRLGNDREASPRASRQPGAFWRT
jgi:hypothetical protein